MSSLKNGHVSCHYHFNAPVTCPCSKIKILNMISCITMLRTDKDRYAIEMIFPVSLLKVLLEGSLSQIFDIAPRFYFMSKFG